MKQQHLERNVAFLVDELKVVQGHEAPNRVFFVSAREALVSRVNQDKGTPTPSGQLLEGFQGRIFEFANFERKFEVNVSTVWCVWEFLWFSLNAVSMMWIYLCNVYSWWELWSLCELNDIQLEWQFNGSHPEELCKNSCNLMHCCLCALILHILLHLSLLQYSTIPLGLPVRRSLCYSRKRQKELEESYRHLLCTCWLWIWCGPWLVEITILETVCIFCGVA